MHRQNNRSHSLVFGCGRICHRCTHQWCMDRHHRNRWPCGCSPLLDRSYQWCRDLCHHNPGECRAGSLRLDHRPRCRCRHHSHRRSRHQDCARTCRSPHCRSLWYNRCRHCSRAACRADNLQPGRRSQRHCRICRHRRSRHQDGARTCRSPHCRSLWCTRCCHCSRAACPGLSAIAPQSVVALAVIRTVLALVGLLVAEVYGTIDAITAVGRRAGLTALDWITGLSAIAPQCP